MDAKNEHRNKKLARILREEGGISLPNDGFKDHAAFHFQSFVFAGTLVTAMCDFAVLSPANTTLAVAGVLDTKLLQTCVDG